MVRLQKSIQNSLFIFCYRTR